MATIDARIGEKVKTSKLPNGVVLRTEPVAVPPSVRFFVLCRPVNHATLYCMPRFVCLTGPVTGALGGKMQPESRLRKALELTDAQEMDNLFFG